MENKKGVQKVVAVVLLIFLGVLAAILLYNLFHASFNFYFNQAYNRNILISNRPLVGEKNIAFPTNDPNDPNYAPEDVGLIAYVMNTGDYDFSKPGDGIGIRIEDEEGNVIKDDNGNEVGKIYIVNGPENNLDPNDPNRNLKPPKKGAGSIKILIKRKNLGPKWPPRPPNPQPFPKFKIKFFFIVGGIGGNVVPVVIGEGQTGYGLS